MQAMNSRWQVQIVAAIEKARNCVILSLDFLVVVVYVACCISLELAARITRYDFSFIALNQNRIVWILFYNIHDSKVPTTHIAVIFSVFNLCQCCIRISTWMRSEGGNFKVGLAHLKWSKCTSLNRTLKNKILFIRWILLPMNYILGSPIRLYRRFHPLPLPAKLSYRNYIRPRPSVDSIICMLFLGRWRSRKTELARRKMI